MIWPAGVGFERLGRPRRHGSAMLLCFWAESGHIANYSGVGLSLEPRPTNSLNSFSTNALKERDDLV